MSRLRSFIRKARLGYAVATAPDQATALCRLVDVEPSRTTAVTARTVGARHLYVTVEQVAL